MKCRAPLLKDLTLVSTACRRLAPPTEQGRLHAAFYKPEHNFTIGGPGLNDMCNYSTKLMEVHVIRKWRSAPEEHNVEVFTLRLEAVAAAGLQTDLGGCESVPGSRNGRTESFWDSACCSPRVLAPIVPLSTTTRPEAGCLYESAACGIRRVKQVP